MGVIAGVIAGLYYMGVFEGNCGLCIPWYCIPPVGAGVPYQIAGPRGNGGMVLYIMRILGWGGVAT